MTRPDHDPDTGPKWQQRAGEPIQDHYRALAKKLLAFVRAGQMRIQR